MSACSWENVGEKTVTLCNYSNWESNMTNSLIGPNGHIRDAIYILIHPIISSEMINSKKDHIQCVSILYWLVLCQT